MISIKVDLIFLKENDILKGKSRDPSTFLLPSISFSFPFSSLFLYFFFLLISSSSPSSSYMI